MKLKILILFFVGFSYQVFAQSGANDFNVESFIIEDSLSNGDPVEKDLGRYNNFEIHLNAGDKFAVDFTTNSFSPLILLLSPEGKKYVYNSANGKDVEFIQGINETGNWNLFIIGGEKDTGKYFCRVSFADSNAVKVRDNLKFCEYLKFFSAHSRTKFIFIKNNLDEYVRSLKNSGGRKISYELNGNRKLTVKIKIDKPNFDFEKTVDKIYACFEDWNVKEGKERKTDDGVSKTVTAIKSGVNFPPIIKVTYSKNSEGKYLILKFGVMN